jgi:hypothetical protein
METEGKRPLTHHTKRLVTLFVGMIILLCTLPMNVFAASGKTEIAGTVYEFDKDSHYEFDESSSSEKSGSNNTYGTFYISGNVSDVNEESGVPAYEVSDGNLSFYYNYGDAVLNTGEDEWHLVDDKSKKVDDMKLSSDIMKGAIIIQTSNDRKNWVDVDTICNAFDDTPIRTSSIYTTTDVQLINGCYYRVMVVYELAVRTEEGKFLFVRTDKYDYKKYAETYEFYAYTDSGDTNVIDPNQTYSLGSKVRAKNFDGYFGEELIDKDDIHYGWDLGNFFVSGYTDKVKDDDGNMVFLKNVGDKVTLWFKLNQNIDKLDNDEDLSITADTEGYDQYFETAKMDFGRGVLIIRYTDYNNVKAEPTVYTNYLEANASVGADTKVQLFEEGDYEVALDYQVTSDELIDKVGHYRIFFKFSVRNGNCMVYPFDVKTGSELTNSSMTENGFRLDLAKSRYLKINLKRETLKDSADGLVEDTRFNGPAKDGAEYTDEGIYTITVSNEYTGQFTTKKIYVGTNNILRAYMTTGLSIEEINNLVEDGATISDDGTIQLATPSPAEETAEPEEETAIPSPSATPASPENATDDETEATEQTSTTIPVAAIIGVFAFVVIVVCIVVKTKKKKRPTEVVDVHHDDEGGAEQ